MIGLLMWLIVGGIIGWLASIVMRTDGQQGL
ncbi:MAG: GlsB/YeaQ/YmgE family stress response rane protein, partial [Sphingomonadales bacterium]|nr:GlsB/YeaQ/YmgE family stress response rane protein [Sphingomonadales bacterium]